MTLSQDIRLRIVNMVQGGVSRRQAAAHFEVSARSAIRFVKQFDTQGHVVSKKHRLRKRRLDPYGEDILAWIEQTPNLTLREVCEHLSQAHSIEVATSTLDDWLRSRKITLKKTAHASEQARPDVQEARAVWRRRQAWLRTRPEQLGKIVFIDETGINTKMARMRGRCHRGYRLVASIPHGHWKTLTPDQAEGRLFIAALRHDQLTAPWVIDGPMDGDAFVQYIETQLAPTLEKGDVVVMDNLSSHKRQEAEQAVRARGAWLLFLPPYSPDLNPIELAFSKFKAHIKRLKPRTVEDLWKAAGKVCDLFKPNECQNFFAADGYGTL